MINKNYSSLVKNYLFAEISDRVAKYKAQNPDKNVISMGIGDVTLPIAPSIIDAMEKATAEMGDGKTFRGYGPYEGYEFLRNALAGYYKELGATLDSADIFVSDGAKNDSGSILDLFYDGCTVVIPDPVYPAYVDANILKGNHVKFVDGNEANGFLPCPPDYNADIVYICSPNNPTGAVYSREGLKAWVDYANGCGAVILFDAAYERFIGESGCPRSIYEIDGAKTCAIELCSFSKTAGFTGVRCGYTVIPSELIRDGASLRDLWLRRAAAKYNGTPYIVQRAAEAVFSEKGRVEIDANISYYKDNAALLGSALEDAGVKYFGGKNSPYIWFSTGALKSWEMFDLLLEKANVVCTPGAGFGKNGEG
ncbi:MAG: LL-diaminopimelate aminotransferase, partial [Ruminococcaceae bacterium]|nr:LL-diaminopimelate aminotransferase [Oscillospiraceae bacterium]